jgi:lipooligosaccharide transport system ATP-binding protein
MPLEIKGLVKRFGTGTEAKEVVRGLDLTLQRGECFALLGPNGAGKTTTLRCALGLAAASAGSIRLCGLPVPEQAR